VQVARLLPVQSLVYPSRSMAGPKMMADIASFQKLCQECLEPIALGALICKTCKSPQTRDLVPCLRCGESVLVRARICRHCKSDLSWRRHLQLSTTTLALLTALIAVIGTVGPAAKELLLPSDAAFSAVAVGEGANGAPIAFLATNVGKKAGAVTEGWVFQDWRVDETRTNQLRIRLVPTAAARTVVYPSKSETVALRVGNDHQLPEFRASSSGGSTACFDLSRRFVHGTCAFQLGYVNSESQIWGTGVRAVPCELFKSTLQSAVDKFPQLDLPSCAKKAKQ
jgi:hypothetical protein